MKTREYDFEGTRTTIPLVRDDACKQGGQRSRCEDVCKQGVQTLAIKV